MSVLACDLGGTSFRAALVDPAGDIAAMHAISGPTGRDRLGWSEIDPEDWWTRLREAAAALCEAEPTLFAQVDAIAICGVTRTQIFLGRDGATLRPAITWRDTRAEKTIGSLLASLPADHPERDGINAFHPLARLAWLRDEEEANFRRLACVLDPKDFLNFKLTGVAASDPVSMARLAAANEKTEAGPSLLGAIGAASNVVPPLREPTDIIGRVREGLPAPLDRLAGARVACCSTDTWTAVAGLGAMRRGVAYNISGTTEVFGLMSAERGTAEGLMSVDWRGLFQLGGPGQNGADTIAWLLDIVGGEKNAPVAARLDALLSNKRDPQPPLFLPYLQGERTPYWDANLRGAFIGLNRNHTATDLVWAVMEGVTFLNRIVLERAEQALGIAATEIRFGGGAAANPLWRQLKADICGRAVVTPAAAEPGLIGAAIVALTATGAFSSLAEAQHALVKAPRRCEPDAQRAATYAPLYDLFRRSETALAPVSRELAALARRSGALPGVHASCPKMGTRSS